MQRVYINGLAHHPTTHLSHSFFLKKLLKITLQAYS